jgi:hypothetical protein
MKPIDHKYIFKYGKDIDKFINYNFNTISEWITISPGIALIKQRKGINDHFSSPHLGVEVLSMSKRIMNEVMCLAEDKNINIFYQDTDSMHILKKDVDKLSMEFENKYSRQLIVNKMGQFHGDFDVGQDEGTSPVSVHGIFLGKKMYCDKVKCIKNGKEEIVFHIRMKGITSEAVIKKSEERGNVIKLYRDMLNGEEISFNNADGNKCKYEAHKNFTTTTRSSFIRRIKV